MFKYLKCHQPPIKILTQDIKIYTELSDHSLFLYLPYICLGTKCKYNSTTFALYGIRLGTRFWCWGHDY